MSPNTVISLETENNAKNPNPFIKKKKILNIKNTVNLLQFYRGKVQKNLAQTNLMLKD